MAGHSKWAKIHRKKGATDQQRGKIFGNLVKEIYHAAKGTDGIINNNPALRVAVENAKSQNMPKENIQKAIDKALGNIKGATFEEITYEGYAPHGVAIMVDTLTDNKNRTAAQVRAAFTKYKGNLGTTGSVNYLFNKRGLIEINKDHTYEEILTIALDLNVEDVIEEDEEFRIITPYEELYNVKNGLEKSGVKEFLVCEIDYIPTTETELEDEPAEEVITLIEALEELDDVTEVYSNLSIKE